MHNKEKEFLKTAYDAVHKNLVVLNRVGECKEIYGAGVGLEGWFQIILLNAFLREGYKVKIKGKVERGCDIIIDDIGIELRAELAQTKNARWFISCLKKHPKADMFLFLMRTTQENSLLNHLEEGGYDKIPGKLNHHWMLWLIKKTKS